MPNAHLRRREGLKAAYHRLSTQKQWALEHLHFAVPIHQTQLQWKMVRVSTLRGLAHDGLARQTFLFEQGSTVPIPFWNLTQTGEAMQRARDGA
ncbi:hypothetical protein [Sphingomonas sp. LaA6.9]|uniref:hypothetical protein n=1 Tax=Sphingomonas sp. LaA6.9 TaxID=2919914 RepID=UPI001F4F6814|nr:hypothetical protein [Sphingomonas sp. LaA6.9]MCJ8158823.1 hypothetical protein [Sphingomonas sp. LaA6.9]